MTGQILEALENQQDDLLRHVAHEAGCFALAKLVEREPLLSTRAIRYVTRDMAEHPQYVSWSLQGAAFLASPMSGESS